MMSPPRSINDTDSGVSLDVVESERPMWVLASASPRRQALIKQLGLSVDRQPAAIDEYAHSGERPRAFALRMAEEKALSVARARMESHIGEAEHIGAEYIIGGDTVVALGDIILGKPEDSGDAVRMLRSLSGEQHDVWSGWAVIKRSSTRGEVTVLCSGVSHAQVQMRAINDEEISRYVESGEPLDKAGSYGIQGRGGQFVKRLDGSLYGVIGLPLIDLGRALNELNLIREPELTLRAVTLRERAATAAWRSGRAVDEVQVLAVSKRHSAERVLCLGGRDYSHFGESYLQEFADKRSRLEVIWAEAQARGEVETPRPVWHYIGAIQRNKAKRIGALSTWIHGVSRFSEAERIAEGARAVSARPKLLIQVNLAGEAQKGGVAPSDVEELITRCQTLNDVEVVGLMTFPPLSEPEESRGYFRALRELRDALNAKGFELPHLSMGTSHDFEIAIEEGATWVRLGRSLFGDRT